MNTSPLMQLTLPGNALAASLLGSTVSGPSRLHHICGKALVGNAWLRNCNGPSHDDREQPEQFKRFLSQRHHILSTIRGETSPSHDG